jgi:hypothetical protein
MHHGVPAVTESKILLSAHSNEMLQVVGVDLVVGPAKSKYTSPVVYKHLLLYYTTVEEAGCSVLAEASLLLQLFCSVMDSVLAAIACLM